MEKIVKIDFSKIMDADDFYAQLRDKIELPSYFGDNLDGLYDVITGDMKMPLTIHFVEMNIDQLENFESLIGTMKDIEEDMDGDFLFSYFMKTYKKREERNENTEIEE